MAYVFKGRLCGYICADCDEPLSNITIRLYRARDDQDVTALAVASPKETLTLLSDEDVNAKASSLLAETATDEDGNFSFELGDKEDYGGEAFEIDLYCDTVPRAPQRRGEASSPLQFTITTLRPAWRRRGDDLIAIWDYCLPFRLWCRVRAWFGAWVVCGKVVDCETRTPLAALTVTAIDRDWLQDDPLGSDVTDGAGRFRIDYTPLAFTPGTFIDVELVPGPDIYFKIEQGATVLLQEAPSRGRDPNRENVGPCFCVELCAEGPEPPFDNPWFTHVGDFHIYWDIDASAGRTNSAVLGHGGPDYGFFGSLQLRGFCPKDYPSGSGDAMRYRFLYEHPSNPGMWIPITGALVAPVIVGSRLIQWDAFGTGLVWTTQTIMIAGAGATPDPTPTPVVPPGTPWGPVPTHVIVPDADGWVRVDQMALDDGFFGPLMGFNTPQAVPGGAAPGNGAGNGVASPRNGVSLKIRFEAQTLSAASTFSDQLNNIYVNNWEEVRLLDLTQFQAPGANACSGLTTALDILYTADHELMADWSVTMSSASPSEPAGNVVVPTPPGATATVRGGFGTKHFDISTWQACSYTVTLTTRRRLTNGINDDDATEASLTFCKT